jgi:T5SS/PEP-CTERM-associated repeat protein
MATYTWLQPSGGDFNVAANWTLDGVNPAPTSPGPADIADFTSGTGTISGNVDVYRIFIRPNTPAPGSPPPPAANWTFTGQIQIGFAIDMEGGTVTLASGANITEDGGIGVAFDPNSSGTFVVEPGATYHSTYPAQNQFYLFNIGEGAGATGTAIIEGPGALVDMEANGASVGPSTGSNGSLEILAGGVAKFATSNPALSVSLQVGRLGTGTVTVDGAGSQLLLTGAMYAGRAGTGTVTLTNGAVLTETAVGSGNASQFGAGGGNPFLTGGTGTLNVLSGSTATFGDSLAFGVNGATGVGLVSDATLNVGGQLRIGRGTTVPGGNGTLTINDGGIVRDTAAADTSTSYVQLGAASGSSGIVNVDGWGSLLDAGANAIDAGIIGAGTLSASDHGLITSTGLTVGDHGNGTLNLTSGGSAIVQTPSGNEAALSVGAQAGGTGSISISGHGSALIAVGEAVLGGTDTGTGAAAGGTGNVSVSQGGLLGTGNMVIEFGSSLGIDGTSAALIAGNVSDGGGITTSGLLAVTGAVSGTGLLTLDGGLANLGSLDTTNVGFGGALAALRVQALIGTSDVSGMQAGDVIDLAGQQGVTLHGDTVTTKSGMLFLSPAPAGDSYRLIHSLDGTVVILSPASGHGMNDMALDDTGPSFASLDDVPNISGDMLQGLGVNPGILPFTATDETAGYIGASAGGNANSAAVNLLMDHQPLAG